MIIYEHILIKSNQSIHDQRWSPPQRAQVAGELRSRRATDFNLLTNHALNVGMPTARKKLLCSWHRRAHVAGQARRPADHVAEATAVQCACMSHELSRAACL